MKRQPIKSPKLYGCGACGTVPPTVLRNDKTFFVGDIYVLSLKIDEHLTIFETEEISLDEIMKRYGDKLAACEFAVLHHLTPLHDVTYEYNHDDGNWYLVEQGQGYA